MEILTTIRLDPDSLNYARPGQLGGVPVVFYVSPYDLPFWGNVAVCPNGEMAIGFQYANESRSESTLSNQDVKVVVDSFARIVQIIFSKKLVSSGDGQRTIEKAIDEIGRNLPERVQLGNFAVVKKAAAYMYPQVVSHVVGSAN